MIDKQFLLCLQKIVWFPLWNTSEILSAEKGVCSESISVVKCAIFSLLFGASKQKNKIYMTEKNVRNKLQVTEILQRKKAASC